MYTDGWWDIILCKYIIKATQYERALDLAKVYTLTYTTQRNKNNAGRHPSRTYMQRTRLILNNKTRFYFLHYRFIKLKKMTLKFLIFPSFLIISNTKTVQMDSKFVLIEACLEWASVASRDSRRAGQKIGYSGQMQINLPKKNCLLKVLISPFTINIWSAIKFGQTLRKKSPQVQKS